MADSKPYNNGDSTLTEDERKVYDRQIRLWGYEGQHKVRKTRVLLIGMQGLGAEIAKNLILTGINSITLKDHTDVSILDSCSQFFISRDSKEPNRAKASLSAAQKLNPNVKVIVDTTPIEQNVDNFVESFDLVIATECAPSTYTRISENCRKAKVPLFMGDVYGLFGYFFFDINFKHSLYGEIFPFNQNYEVPIDKKNTLPFYLATALLRFHCEFNRKPNPETSEEDIEELKSIISTFSQDHIPMTAFEEYFSELFCALSPATSIIGALIAQTALNLTMSKPLNNQNMFFYDHVQHEGRFILH